MNSLEGRSDIIIDIDSTDGLIHGRQQLSMIHGSMGNLCIMSFSSMTDRPARLSFQYCVRPIAIRIGGMWPYWGVQSKKYVSVTRK